jgi:FkbM family methyltransferase
MGIKHFIGSTTSSAVKDLIRSQRFPLTRYFPRGFDWIYDAQRFANTRKFQTIFDVGANVGQTAAGLASAFPNADIYCFEPISESFRVLDSRFGKRTHCLPIALGSAPAIMKVNLRRDSETNSLLSTDPDVTHYTGEVETIEVSTADLVCAQQRINSIDILKMDVQGWELEVLLGASAILGGGRVRFIFSEVGFDHRSVEMVSFGDIFDAVTKYGFIFCGFYDAYRYGPQKRFVPFCNALFLNPKFETEQPHS